MNFFDKVTEKASRNVEEIRKRKNSKNRINIKIS